MGRSPFYREDNFAAANSIGYLLKTASNLLQPAMETAFADSDLTLIQWKVLMYLRDDLASTCADISRDLPYDAGSLTRIIDDLERKDYLRRDRSTTDRRVVSLKLTPEGRVAVEAALPRVIALLNAALEGFTREDTKALIDLLVRFVAGVRAMRKDGILPAGERSQ